MTIILLWIAFMFILARVASGVSRPRQAAPAPSMRFPLKLLFMLTVITLIVGAWVWVDNSPVEVAISQPTNEVDMEPVPEAPLITESFLHKVAYAESGLDTKAKSKTSTSSGLFGFTNKTWKSVVSVYGKARGVRLKDKDKPHAQRIMAHALLEENVAVLTKLLNRYPTHGEVYMAHVFGPRPAATLIAHQGTGKKAVKLFPKEVVAANKSIFWKGKHARTVEEVYDLLEGKVA